jgi:putative hemolysin
MPAMTNHIRPFSFDMSRTNFLLQAVGRVVAPVVERVLGLTALNEIYLRSRETDSATPHVRQPSFAERVLATMNIKIEVHPGELACIPSTGPLIVAANHPFGGIEGVALLSLVMRIRGDVKVLSNYLLQRIPELRESSIFVDPFGGAAAARRNIAPLREVIAWISAGRAMVVFPAGEVAHFSLRARRIAEPAWHANIVGIALRTGAVTVPVHIAGANSALFHGLGLLHPRLRTALLPREFLRRRGRKLSVSVGSPVPPKRLQRFADALGAADYLRFRSLILHSYKGRAGADHQTASEARRASAGAEIVAPKPAEVIENEIRSLPGTALLVESGDFEVFAAPSRQIPNVLTEIGRLREVTFREAGEGTGRAIDLDRFDEHYVHLFIWDQRNRRIAGAYRLGYTTDLVASQGLAGMYTSTLFRFDERLLSRIGPAVELGRSFVTVEYQRSYSALMLLWKGIARAVSLRPDHRTLFGVVSVSADYDSMTKRLLMSFLKLNNFAPALARLVRPLNPPRLGDLPAGVVPQLGPFARDIDQFDALARELESGRRGVPVLLRHYLRLGAKVLGFNIDPDFGNVLDALVVVDLTQSDRSILDRFFGHDAAAAFLAHHGAEGSPKRASVRVA